jgi:hypothetical protein
VAAAQSGDRDTDCVRALHEVSSMPQAIVPGLTILSKPEG